MVAVLGIGLFVLVFSVAFIYVCQIGIFTDYGEPFFPSFWDIW